MTVDKARDRLFLHPALLTRGEQHRDDVQLIIAGVIQWIRRVRDVIDDEGSIEYRLRKRSRSVVESQRGLLRPAKSPGTGAAASVVS